MSRINTLGPFPLDAELDTGTLGSRFSTTFEGRDAIIECVALRSDDELFDRFVRHIEVLANIEHAHIVPLLDAGLDQDHLFIVTPMPDTTACQIGPTDAAATLVADAAAGLAELHERGIVHRNVQPRHLGVYDGVVKLGGIGLADLRGTKRTCGIGPIGAVLTMPPSIVQGSPATTGSDVYSLGATLHLLATGAALHPVDPSESLVQRLGRISRQRSLLSPYLAPGLRPIVTHAIESDGCDTSAPLDRLRSELQRHQEPGNQSDQSERPSP